MGQISCKRSFNQRRQSRAGIVASFTEGGHVGSGKRELHHQLRYPIASKGLNGPPNTKPSIEVNSTTELSGSSTRRCLKPDHSSWVKLNNRFREATCTNGG